MDFIMENIIEWVGYLASFIILVALTMSSVKKLRIINLFGASLFIVYGLIIEAFPVMIMNIGIVFVNIYYLRQMYKAKDYFKVIAVDKNDEYLKAFLAFYRDQFETAMNFTDAQLSHSDYRFLILRNMNPAGVFILEEQDEDALKITLDYATPEYQDFKTTDYAFKKTNEVFVKQGYKKFITETTDEKHIKYLTKMNFKETVKNGKTYYEKMI